MMIDAIPQALVHSHRALLVIASVLTAIASTLAVADTRVGDWLMLLGSAALLFVADAFREIGEDSSVLASSTKTSRRQATASLYESRGGKKLSYIFWLSIAAAVGGLLAATLLK